MVIDAGSLEPLYVDGFPITLFKQEGDEEEYLANGNIYFIFLPYLSFFGSFPHFLYMTFTKICNFFGSNQQQKIADERVKKLKLILTGKLSRDFVEVSDRNCIHLKTLLNLY